MNASETLDNPAHIAINTTVGTGSETTPAYVITDTTFAERAAQVGRVRPGVPSRRWRSTTRSVMTQPPQYVAYTGFDTMAHASECYVGRVQDLSTTPSSLRAVKLVEENLREATDNPNNYEAMTKMVWAQYMAAQAFSTGLLGHLALALARGLRVLRHPPRPEQRRRHRRACGPTTSLGVRSATRTSPARCTRDTPHMTDLGRPPTRRSRTVIRLASDCGCPENWVEVGEYPKTRMGKG